MRRSAPLAVAALVAALAAVLALAGCGQVSRSDLSAAVSPAPTGTPSSSLPSAAPIPSPTAVGTGSGGAGSLTLAITSPLAVAGHVNTDVACAVSARTYHASVASAEIQGYSVTMSVRIVGHAGPGSWSGTLSGTITEGGVTYPLALPAVPVTTTASGGSLHLSVTESGHTLSGEVDWACGA
jgi:hypothetical protein